MAQQDFEEELSKKLNEIFRTTNIFYDIAKLVANDLKNKTKYDGTTVSKEEFEIRDKVAQ